MGSTSNAVAPGTTKTEMTKDSLATEEGLAWQLARIPMGRVGQPDDIAAVVLFPVLGRRELHHRAHARRRRWLAPFLSRPN